MPRVLKREAAKRDLIQRWVWYAENATIEAVDRFLVAVEGALRNLASHPLSGQAVFLRSNQPGIRRYPAGRGFEKILLFYRPITNGIELIRVLHGSQDLPRLFDPPGA